MIADRSIAGRPLVLATVVTLIAACAPAAPPPSPAPRLQIPEPSDVRPSIPREAPWHAVVPLPASIAAGSGGRMIVDSTVGVVFGTAAGTSATAGELDAAQRIAGQLTTMLGGNRPAPRMLAAGDSVPLRSIRLVLDAAQSVLGTEGYDLVSSAAGVTITAPQPEGLFRGMQTLRQLMPAGVEHAAAIRRQLYVEPARITDAPRFAWRGAMLDVSRHFLEVGEVERFVDAMALYKLNRLHLHLSDDQGWRIEIKSWPNLAEFGGQSEVGGGRGGFYTQDELRHLVAYARERYIEIVPEIDVPGHTNAALSAYGELNCDGVAREPYHGTRVGFSALCVTREDTYRFLSDVVREIGAITGPWFHIGGDEVERLSHDDYLRFIERTEGIVRGAGKTMLGWGEIAPARLDAGTIVQHWRRDSSAVHAARGGKVIMSPSSRMYLDMKYDSTTVLGLQWAGRIEVRDAYDWDPEAFLPGIGAGSVLGVEAPLWSETLEKLSDFEHLAFPRLAAVAEIGWTPQPDRDWDEFRQRLAAHGPRLAALGVNFYRSPQVPWVR